MKTIIFKRGASLLLAMLMCLSTLIGVGLTASADEITQTAKTVVFSFPRDGDDNYKAEWGHEDLSFMNGWFRHSAKRIHIFSIGSWTGNICYCLEPGTPITNDQTLTYNDESFFDDFPSELNNTISADNIRLFLGRIMQYGYCGTVSTSWRSQNEEDADKMAHAVATQIIIWETIVGERDELFNHVDTGSYNRILEIVSVNNPLHDRIMSYYNSMVKSVQTHAKVPSFCKRSALNAHVAKLSWNGSEYSVTLTDTNNVLGNYTFTTNNAKVTCSVSGNKLTISSNTAITSEVTITANKVNAKRKGVVVWGDGVFDTAAGDIQDLVTYSAEVDDPVVGYMQVKASFGSAKIVKTSEDGKVSGVKFTVVGNGINTTVTTNVNGEIVVPNLTAGTYTVTELTDDIYNPQQSKTVTVVSGQTAIVHFHNTLKRGNLVITKTSEDGLVKDCTFHLYGYSLSGIYVNEYATTDDNGIAEFKKILIGTNYILEEYNCPNRYVVPELQNAVIEWNNVCNIGCHNKIKKGTVIGKKIDEDGFIIAGALFGLFKPDETIFTEETAIMVSESNEIGVFGFENVPYGDWLIRELKPAPAFVLNEEIFEASITQNEQIVEITAVNRFICGSVRVWKVDEEVLGNKLSNAVFAIYCDVDGNGEYKAEIDMLVGELSELEAGLYGMDNLRYNGYFLHEEKAPEGFIKDDNYYHFEIRNDGEVIFVENQAGVGFANKSITGELKILKIDSETKQPLANVGFRVMDTDDNVIQEAYTDENGIVSFKLRYGEYTYCEFSPLEGYYATDEVYPFSIIEDGKVIEIEVENETVPDPDIPRTGDNLNVVFWCILLVISSIGIVFVGRKISKERY